MNRCCTCGWGVNEAWWIVYGCCHRCLRQPPMVLTDETRAETAEMMDRQVPLPISADHYDYWTRSTN